jgi:modulator of FtsH protease HflK
MKLEVEGKIVEVPIKPIGIILLAFVVVLSALSLFYQIAPEQEGLVLRFGRHIKTAPPGLHFKLPFGVDQVVKVPTRIVDVEAFGYRDRARGQQATGLTDENSMLTGDLNIVLAGWDVQFSREHSRDFVFNVQDPINTLRDISQSVMREVMGDRASILILTVGRSEIQQRVRELIQRQCDQFGMGIRINEVNLLFVDPPAAVIDAFNDLNKAEQDAVRFYEEASREYQERVPRARGAAQRLILEAEGFQQQRVNVARGEAGRFTDMLVAYELSPQVTRERLYLEAMERRLPALREIIIVDDELPGILPHLNMRQTQGGTR